MSNIIDSIQLSGVTYTIQGSGGGKTIEAGRGISVTTGETADTVSFNLPISAGTGGDSIVEGYGTSASGTYSHAEGFNTQARGNDSHAEGNSTLAYGNYSHAEGYNTFANSNYSHAEGYYSTANGNYSHAEGNSTIANNQSEHASGQYNVSNKANNTFGNSGNTLFSVGNGTSYNARHNAFEIRQNGDIYITSGGTDIKLQDNLGGGNPTVELTQAEYDALVTAGTVSPTTYYIITDAQAGDLTQYWTSAQTQSAITQATSGKVDTSTYNTYTAATDTALANKQTTLTAGTGINITDNVISATGGGGGGKAVSGGTNISITTGETADTINCTLPIREGSNSSGKGIIVGDSECTASGLYGISLGHSSDAIGAYSFCNGSNSYARGQMSFAHGDGCDAKHDYAFMIGDRNISTKSHQYSFGNNVKPKNNLEFGFGTYNNSSSASTTFGHSGNTMFSIGNGYDFSSTHNWHNAFEVRQNGDIYVPNTDDTSVTGDKAYSLYPMVRLQDTITATAANTTALGGLKLVKLTQSEYDNLSTKDNSTLYVIVN